MKHLLNEPLLHFLLLGAALFVTYNFVSQRDDDAAAEPGRIVVTRGAIENLAVTFARTWKRPAEEKELAGLIEDYVREEVYYREALAMGLDRDDTIVRRRLRQRLEFVTDDIAAIAEPTDAELTAYLNTHSEAFRVERRFTFSHVYFNPDRRGERLDGEVARALDELQRTAPDADLATVGDPFVLERTFHAVPGSAVAAQFGETFAAALTEVPAGKWHGPLESGYGVHLVFVGERAEGRLPALADVRDAVRREWDNARRREANAKFYEELRKRYTVTIEDPGPNADRTKLAEAE